MLYYVLTLGETSGLFLGLAIQTMVRNSPLRHLVWMIVLFGTLMLLSRRQYVQALWYSVLCMFLCILFWPDLTPFGRNATRMVRADSVRSYAASQSPGADVVTAEDTGDVPEDMLGMGTETYGFRLMLPWITDIPLGLARAINSQVRQPFSAILPMQWLLGMDLTADVTRALADWIEGCYKPSLASDKEFQDAITAEQLWPWGNTPVAQALASRDTVPGSHTGKGYFRGGEQSKPLNLMFMSNPGSSNAQRCDVYLAAVEREVQSWLYEQKSPAGTPLLLVFEEDLKMDPISQGRFIIYREMMRAMGRPAPAPSLGGAYAAAAAGNAALGGLSGIVRSPGSALSGFFRGGAEGLISPFQRGAERLLDGVTIAAWLLYWMPYLLGLLLLMLIGFFPIVFLWALCPGSQFRPLITYFFVLGWVCSSPLWFAITDLAARSAASQASQSQDVVFQLFNWAPAQMNSVVVTVIGIFIVPLVMARIFFVSFRSVDSFLRGGS